jgi:hypothetical protein
MEIITGLKIGHGSERMWSITKQAASKLFYRDRSQILKQQDPAQYIVAYLPKARTVEPEKQSLLAKDSETKRSRGKGYL